MTNDLIERLEKTAKTMNGGGSVGASDGMGTTLVGYYDTSCAKLDLEAAAALRSKDAEIAKLRAALNDIASFNDKSADKILKHTGSYSCFDEPYSVEVARTALGGGNE